MNGSIERRLRSLEEQFGIHDEPACPECGTGQQIVILHEDEPEPICDTCGRPKARNDGKVRVIRIACREDGPQ